MFYNDKIKIGDETYRWIEIVNSAIAYKNHRWDSSIFMLENTEAEKQRIRRLYNWTEGAFDYREHHGWKERYRENLITRYFQDFWEGKEE